MTGTADCWAPLAIGHAAAAPPSRPMKSRRLMLSPEFRTGHRSGSKLHGERAALMSALSCRSTTLDKTATLLPLYPQQRTSPRTARRTTLCARSGPEYAQHKRWTEEALFDHFVSTREERRRNGEAKCLGDLEVDYELEFGWLEGRRFGRFRAVEDVVNIDSCLAVHVEQVGPITD